MIFFMTIPFAALLSYIIMKEMVIMRLFFGCRASGEKNALKLMKFEFSQTYYCRFVLR